MFEQPKHKQSKLNLTPLIDIIFQLVIFFMLSTTFIKTEALDVFVADETLTEPKGAAKKLSKIINTENFRLEVFAAGKVEINGQAIAIDNLEQVIIDKLNINPGQRIDIIVRDKAKVQDLVDIVDIVKKADATNISINSIEN